MRQHLDVLKLLLVMAHVFSGESLMHFAVSLPQNDFDLRLSGDITTQKLIRKKYYAIDAE